MHLSSTTSRKLAIQMISLMLIVLVADYMTDRTFPHHWIIFVMAGGLLALLLVVYLALGPDS